MEKFQEVREKAKKHIQIADHMISVTYPLINDNKLLLAIIENIFLAYTNIIGCLLYYERLFKKIPPFQDNFESKFTMFKETCVLKYKIGKSYIADIQDLKNIILAHRKSPMEFSRKDRFVICSNNYKLQTININELKKHIDKAKLFIQEINNITSKDEGLFKQG
ncbi:hypothetical protein KY343_02140 [Candidatus Woesearchaeota archaeon]|nr:hypothetical protein [Candidatus Woesearchaeota archaeon]